MFERNEELESQVRKTGSSSGKLETRCRKLEARVSDLQAQLDHASRLRREYEAQVILGSGNTRFHTSDHALYMYDDGAVSEYACLSSVKIKHLLCPGCITKFLMKLIFQSAYYSSVKICKNHVWDV